MKKRIKITGLPKFKHGGHWGPQTPPEDRASNPALGSYDGGNDPEIKINETLQPTDREHSTLEAELGETVITNLDGGGIPEFYKIAGKRHSQGGTPLNLPPDSFIFSRDNSMKIKDPMVLNMFGKKGDKPKAATPAELSKNYNINKYRAILEDPSSDKLQIETAEMMIKNYNLKLGALALAQESTKGFQDDIPMVAMPYIQSLGVDPSTFVNPEPPEGLMQEAQAKASQDLAMFKKGGQPKGKRKVKITKMFAPGGALTDEEIQMARQLGITDPGFSPEGTRQRIKEAQRNAYIDQQMMGQGRGGRRRARVTKAPQYSARPTAKQNIPKDAVRWDPSKDGYNRNDVKPGDYILQDGRYRKVTGFKKKAYEGEFADDRLGGLSDDYGLLQDKISDPKIKAELVKRYRETMKNVKPNSKTGLTQEHINQAAAMSGDEIIDNFMDAEKRVYALGNKYKNSGDYDPDDTWDKGATRGKVNEELKSLDFDPLDTVHTTAFQAVYSDLQKMADDPEFKNELKDFKVAQIGMGDEPGAGTGKSTVSDIDGWWGNTTAGQTVIARDSEMETEDVPLIEPDDDPKEVEYKRQKAKAPWFLQDKIQLGSDLGTYFGVEKEKPWRSGLFWKGAKPSLTDFRGTAARLQSGAQGQLERIAPFTGGNAGSLLAASGEIQRGMNPALLQAQEAEYKGNQAIMNEFEKFNTQSQNQFNMAKSQWDSERYADQLEANTRFKNAKSEAWQNVINTTKQGITNAAYAQAANLATPNFQMHPEAGGMITYHETPYDLEANQKGPSASQTMQRIVDENPNLKDTERMKIFEYEMGPSPTKKSRAEQMAPLMGALPPYYNATANPRNARQSYRYNMNRG